MKINQFLYAALAGSLTLDPAAFANIDSPISEVPVTPVAQDVVVNPDTPVASATPSANPPASWQNSPVWQAYIAAAEELAPVFKGDDIKSRIDRLGELEFSAETKKKLFDVFGNDNPLHFKRKNLKNGNAELSVMLDSLDYQQPVNGCKTHFAALDSLFSYNKKFTRGHSVTTLPSINWEIDPATRLIANELSYVTNSRLDTSHLWLGTTVFKMDRLEISNNSGAFALKLDGMTMKSDLKKHGRMLDVDLDYFVKSTSWGSDGLGQTHMALRVVNLDAKQFDEMTRKIEKLDQSKLSKAEHLAVMTEMMKEFALTSMNHGAALDIQDISAQYHGMTAGLNGRISFKNIQRTDMESPKLFGEKVVARVNIHVPVALLNEVARAFTRITLKQQNISNRLQLKAETPVTDELVNAQAKEMVVKGVSNLLNKKYISIKRETILSTIEFKQGKLFINGQLASFP